jgi:hypothetical protein
LIIQYPIRQTHNCCGVKLVNGIPNPPILTRKKSYEILNLHLSFLRGNHFWSKKHWICHCTDYNIVWMLSVVLLIIGVQYYMNVVCSSLDYRGTILYECCLCCSLDYRQYCTPIIKWTTKTTFIQYYNPIIKRTTKITCIQYCTPIIKRTTDNIHTILYTYNQENYRQHSYNIVLSL